MLTREMVVVIAFRCCVHPNKCNIDYCLRGRARAMSQ